MFEMKMRARYKLRGENFSLFLSSVLSPCLFLLGLTASAVVLMTFYFGYEAVFPYLGEDLAVTVTVFFGLAAVFLLFFSVARSLYFNARLFCREFPSEGTPDRFYTVKQSLRYLYCRIFVSFMKFLWALLFFSPSFSVAFFTYLTVTAKGEMIKSIFITLVVLSVFLFLTGLVFYFTVTGRYYLSCYLIMVNPLEDVRSSVDTGVRLLKHKLIRIAFIRIRLLPYRILSVLLPFAFTYRVFFSYLKLLISANIYSGNVLKNTVKRETGELFERSFSGKKSVNKGI